MPVKKATMKRKLKTSIEPTEGVPPQKIIKAVAPRTPIKGAVTNSEEVFEAKRSVDRVPGLVLTLGQGDVGQLGLGPDVMERARPALVPGLADIVDVCAGGMHTICLTNSGEVITFGCNDEGALGRPTTGEGSEMTPGKVELDGKAVQISAGDSHSAALLQDGRVFAWGAFRDSHGTMGLTADGVKKEPVLMELGEKVSKIVSGTDHLLMLTNHGHLFSCGCGEQGQLGRLSERAANRNSRQGMDPLLSPGLVKSSVKSKQGFDNMWTGAYCTFARERKTGKIYVFGLNNYKQLGVDAGNNHFHFPQVAKRFLNKTWIKICGGQHHTLALDSDGVVYTLGREDYGMLGLGKDSDNSQPVDQPTVVPALRGKKCIDIACGSCVSLAVTEQGELYAWGMGTNGQLGTGDDDDRYEPTKMAGKQLEGRAVMAVSAGGQHTVLLVKDSDSTAS